MSDTEGWGCSDCGYTESAPTDELAGRLIKKTVGEGRRTRVIETAVCPECKSETEQEDWRDMLSSMAELDNYSEDIFRDYSVDVAGEMPLEAAWSVDFAFGSHGGIYAIDMALGDVSSHPDCPMKEPIETGEVLETAGGKANAQ